MTIISSNFNWGGTYWKGILKYDAKGYYAYLPAVFIYGDLNYDFFEKIEKEKYFDANHSYDYRADVNGQKINKYYCGTALAELPFFLIAHFYTYYSDYQSDGYSKPYPVLISVGALFYLLIGLIFLNAILGLYGIGEWQKSLTLFAAVFGTNLYYYTLGESGMTHVYSFAFISMFYYYVKLLFNENNFHRKYIVILAIILALIILIRPINVLVIFAIPFIAGTWEQLKKGMITLFSHPQKIVISGIVFLGILSLQVIIYKISVGQFLVYSYAEEGFNFLSPHLTDILFSYQKGLFVYTPIYLIALVGLYFLSKTSRFASYSWGAFFILITYVFSSWHMWFYGGSFSSRVYVEYIPLFMIPMAIALKEIKLKWPNRIYKSIIILLIIVCQIQTYQYRHGQIHWNNMTKEKYWNVFLRIDKIIQGTANK